MFIMFVFFWGCIVYLKVCGVIFMVWFLGWGLCSLVVMVIYVVFNIGVKMFIVGLGIWKVGVLGVVFLWFVLGLVWFGVGRDF